MTPNDFNSYGARRGNDRVMTRGTFANIRLKNLIAPGTEGSVAIHFPTGEQTSIYDAAGQRVTVYLRKANHEASAAFRYDRQGDQHYDDRTGICNSGPE